jgi:hypothetical protein
MAARSTIAIPSIIWESVEIAFRTSGKQIIKKVAKMLHVDDNELVRNVMPPGESIKMILYETDDIKECPAWIPHPLKPDFAIHCRKAIIPGEEYCQIHKHCRCDVQNSIEHLLELEKIQTPPEIPPLWMTPGTDTIRNVINIEGKIVGLFNTENNSLTYFTFSQ